MDLLDAIEFMGQMEPGTIVDVEVDKSKLELMKINGQEVIRDANSRTD